MRFRLFKRKAKGPSLDTRIDARDHQFTTPREIVYKPFKRRKLKTCVTASINHSTDEVRDD